MNKSYGDIIDQLSRNGRLRSLTPLTGRRGCRVERDGKVLLNLISNDYLGLAGNSDIQAEFYKELDSDTLLEQFGLGAASSRLLSGDSPLIHDFEAELASAYGFEAALFFNSGYHANIGLLPALFDKRDLILSDKLNHASIHDGLRLCTAAYKRYRHCDYEHLESILKKNRHKFDRAVIVTESVFSMDGDSADLGELVRLRNEYDCLLYVDEAHSIGLYGDRGLGKAEEQGVLDQVDLLVGPLGKAFASIGCFLLCSDVIRSYLINHSRSLIFTTALPPVVINWNRYVFKKILGMHRERDHLRELHEQLRKELNEQGLKTGGETNIVPVLIGDNQRAVKAAELMQELGYLLLAVRPPTVPEGTARFRLSLTADMQLEDLKGIPSAISTCLNRI